MIRRLIQLVLDQAAAQKLEREVGRSMSRVAKDSESKMLAAFKKISAAMIAAFSVKALVGFAREMFKLGSTAEETASKFATVFGEKRAAELDAFLDRFGRMAAITRTAGREMLANFGSVFQGAGIATDAAADLSEQMVRLAADLQSFHDVPIEQTFAAIRSGATGESEPLKRFGIILREADVRTRALRISGKELASELTEQDRVLARVQLMYEKAGVAIGDMERTQHSAANRARRLSAQLADIREKVAIGLMPALEGLIPTFEQLADKAEMFANQTGTMVRALLDLAGIAKQDVAIEIAGITRQLQGMEEAQRQAFLTSRLQQAGREYEAARVRVEELTAAIEAARERWTGGFGARARAKELEQMQRELEIASEVMNAISTMMGQSPTVAAPVLDGGEDGPVAVDDAQERLRRALEGVNAGLDQQLVRLNQGEAAAYRFALAQDGITGAEQDAIVAKWQQIQALERELELRGAATEAAEQYRAQIRGMQEGIERERIALTQGAEAAFRYTLALQGITGEHQDMLVRQQAVVDSLRATRDAATSMAEGMTSAFEGFFEATADALTAQGSVWAAAGQAARNAGAAVLEGLTAGRAEEQMAAGTAALASGIWPPNPAAIAASAKHYLAAGLFKAIPGIVAGRGGGGGGMGGVGAIPRGPIGTSAPGTQSLPGAEVHIYLDPLSPNDPRFQRVLLGAEREAREIWGNNANIRHHTAGAMARQNPQLAGP